MNALDARSIALRRDVRRMVVGGGRGHVASAFSLIEILRVLYDDVLRYRPDEPHWRDRDRLILSKGHGCMALYAILADRGFFPKDEFDRFSTYSGILGGHPEYGKVPGVEASTGALGHGLPIGIGMALDARIESRDNRVFVIIGDGECDEGSIWESALAAAKHRLDNLTVVVDYNKMQSYGATSEVLELEPFPQKWASFGFGVRSADGHDVDQLRSALLGLPFEAGKPNALICHTVKGRGIAQIESNLEWHHVSRLTDDAIKVLNALDEDPK